MKMNTFPRLSAVLVVAVLVMSSCLSKVDRGLDEESVEGDITPRLPSAGVLFGPIDGQDAFDAVGGFDKLIKHGGERSAVFLATAVTKDDQIRLTQRFLADQFIGKRIRFTAYVKTNQVNGWAGLWMRVDTIDKHAWAFDDMEDYAIEGTTDWEQYQIVLDVPEDGAVIYLGAHLYGRGQVWMDDCTFEVVGDDVPVSDGTRMRGGYPRVYSIPQFMEYIPLNLDFEETEFL